MSMEKERKDVYLTNEQLQELIAGTEDHMVQAPEYLEQMILRKAEPEFIKESVEIVPIRHAIPEAKPLLKEKEKRQKDFRLYTIKIVAAAATILILLTVLPSGNSFFMEQAADIRMENRNTTVKHINQKTSEFCGSILEKTNQLFQKGE